MQRADDSPGRAYRRPSKVWPRSRRRRRSRAVRRRCSPTAANAPARFRRDRECCRAARRSRRYRSAAPAPASRRRHRYAPARRRAATIRRARRPCKRRRRAWPASVRRERRFFRARSAPLRLSGYGGREETGQRREHGKCRLDACDVQRREFEPRRSCCGSRMPSFAASAASRSSERSAAIRSSSRIVSSCRASRLRRFVSDGVAQAGQARGKHDVAHQQRQGDEEHRRDARYPV